MFNRKKTEVKIEDYSQYEEFNIQQYLPLNKTAALLQKTNTFFAIKEKINQKIQRYEMLQEKRLEKHLDVMEELKIKSQFSNLFPRNEEEQIPQEHLDRIRLLKQKLPSQGKKP